LTAWDFASEVYGRPGVAASCLALQDEHAQCVSYLLWRLWVWRRGDGLEAGDLARAAELARRWEDAVLRPLRAVRTDLKPPIADVGDAARETLRAAILAGELQAERLLLDSLEALPRAPGEAAPDALAALQSAVDAWGRPAPPALLAELARAC
jgi:uncharacterized protein (TIGR02444 family)